MKIGYPCINNSLNCTVGNGVGNGDRHHFQAIKNGVKMGTGTIFQKKIKNGVNSMNKINELAGLFKKYRIYPKSCYNDCSPARVFQRMFPENHYSRDLEAFLSRQNHESTQRGADLPWWGEKSFSEESGCRIMVISQDSRVKDAGSIVLAAQFFPPHIGFEQYQEIYPEYVQKLCSEYVDKNGKKAYFPPNRLKRVANKLTEWGIDFNFLYITDASKVYKDGSWKDRDFDKEKSKELLEAEIEFCNPDLIILLGTAPLRLLDKTKNYAFVVEGGEPLLIKDKKCVVSPFFIGQGPSGNKHGKGFEKRLEVATRLIKKELIKK